MKPHFELKSILQSIDGKGYKFYKSLEDEYLFGDYSLFIDHVQGDPYGSPSKIRVLVSQDKAGFSSDTYSSRSREIALRDFITREFNRAIKTHTKANMGLEKTDIISIDNPGQEILDRTSCFINESFVEVRFTIGLPDLNGNVSGKEAEEIFFYLLPKIIESSLFYESLDKESLYKHIETAEDADFLRNELENLRLIAFVGDGSILPRESESSSLPMSSDIAVPFVPPENLKMDVELPNLGQITGMGIPRGITFILGSDSKSKTTLLNAIAMGIYNYIPGDGREFVVSNPNTVKICPEEGRNVSGVNISAFTDNTGSSCFSTNNADLFTSFASNIVEAVEVGADVLVIDRDGTDLFIDKARGLFNEYMVSSILAAEELEKHNQIANFVIQMNDNKAKDLALEKGKKSVTISSHTSFGQIADRIPLSSSISSETLDLSRIEQVVSESQINTISDAIEYSKKYMDGKKSFRQITSLVMMDLGRSGLDILSPTHFKDYAEFRKIELVAAINRIRTLKVEQK